MSLNKLNKNYYIGTYYVTLILYKPTIKTIWKVLEEHHKHFKKKKMNFCKYSNTF